MLVPAGAPLPIAHSAPGATSDPSAMSPGTLMLDLLSVQMRHMVAISVA